MKGRETALLLLGVALLAGCARVDGKGGDTAGGGADVNWEQPIAHAERVESASTAHLPYVPDPPDGLGTPTSIFVTAPDAGPAALREVAWVYLRDAERFYVVERVVRASAQQAEVKQLLSESPGCRTISPDADTAAGLGEGAGPTVECVSGRRSSVRLADGVETFVFEGDVTTTIEWLEPLDVSDEPAFKEVFGSTDGLALYVTIVGPAQAMSGQDAVRLAKKF